MELWQKSKQPTTLEKISSLHYFAYESFMKQMYNAHNDITTPPLHLLQSVYKADQRIASCLTQELSKCVIQVT